MVKCLLVICFITDSNSENNLFTREHSLNPIYNGSFLETDFFFMNNTSIKLSSLDEDLLRFGLYKMEWTDLVWKEERWALTIY